MKGKILFLTCMLGIYWTSAAQITLEDCYLKARENYPLIRQNEWIKKTEAYNLSNASKGYLPQFQLSAKASYQSDVTKIPIHMEGIKEIDKDQYGLTLDMNQTIWDGGEIRSVRDEIRAASEVDKQNWEVNMYAIRERINQLYFGILLLDMQIQQNDIYQEDLRTNYARVESYLQNGVAHKADLDVVQVECLKARQARIQLTHTRAAYLAMLSSFIGENLPEETVLEKPVVHSPADTGIQRPELSLFEARINHFAAQQDRIQAGLMPKIGLFATGGYGRPSLNMLDNDLQAYFLAGVRLSWNIGNFYTQKNNKRLIATSIHSIQTQKETFLFNTRLEITQQEKEIDSYKEQLAYDDEIIDLRRSVQQASETKIANGTLSGSDLVRDIHATHLAGKDKNLHEIEMLLALYKLKFITNH